MTRRPHSSRWLLLGLTWLAFALRVAGITAQSLWRDEVDALIFATRPLSELLAMFRQPGQNGPLFFLALRPWLAAAGWSEFALRLPSALAGALAVPIFYMLMRRLVHDRKPAAIAALLMATAPYLIWYGQEAKMYAALTVLAPASLLLTVEVSRRGGWWRWLLLYVITSLCFYTHLLAALIVPVQALWLLILPSAPSRRLRRWLAVGLYLAALILPYLPLLRWQAPTWLSLTYQTGHPFVPLGDILLVLTSAFSRGVLPVEQPQSRCCPICSPSWPACCYGHSMSGRQRQGDRPGARDGAVADLAAAAAPGGLRYLAGHAAVHGPLPDLGHARLPGTGRAGGDRFGPDLAPAGMGHAGRDPGPQSVQRRRAERAADQV